MKRINPRLLYAGVLLVVFAYIFIGSAKPVKVYKVPIQLKDTAQTVSEVPKVSQYMSPPEVYYQSQWKWTAFLVQLGMAACIGAGVGVIIGLLSGETLALGSLLPGVLSAAMAGFITGIILGGVSYTWEYLYGYEVMNTIYWLPKGSIDFSRE